MSPEHPTSVSSSLTTLRIIHLAFLAGQVSFLAVVVFLCLQNEVLGFAFPPGDELGLILLGLVAALSMSNILIGNMIWRRVRADESLSEEHLRTTAIVRMALLEGVSLFAVVSLLLTGDLVFLVLCGALIAIFATYCPSAADFAGR